MEFKVVLIVLINEPSERGVTFKILYARRMLWNGIASLGYMVGKGISFRRQSLDSQAWKARESAELKMPL